MPTPPSADVFVSELADLARDLRRGTSCLVVCDKGWTGPVCAAIRDRLKPVPPDYERAVAFRYLDWRPTTRHPQLSGGAALPAQALQSLRDAVCKTFNDAGNWTPADDQVFALPYLDVMTAVEGGWTPESREVIVLLNENPTMVWLGFCDPSVTLPPLVQKAFTREYRLTASYLDAVRETDARRLATELALAEANKPAPVEVPEPESEAPAPETALPQRDPDAVAYPWEPGDDATSSPGARG
jgi:hypothetical protein